MIDVVNTTTVSAEWPIVGDGPTVAQLDAIVKECKRVGVPDGTRLLFSYQKKHYEGDVTEDVVTGLRLLIVTDDRVKDGAVTS